MGVHLATEFCLILHGTQLQQAPVGEVVYGDICFLHTVDRSLLLHDGVDGECINPTAALHLYIEREIHSTRGEYGLGFQPRHCNSQLLQQ